MSSPKESVYVEAGRRGARKRWGEPRVLRLDQLDPDERRLIQAILTLKRNVAAQDEREGAADAAA